MSKSNHKSEFRELLSKMSDDELMASLREAGFEVKYVGENKGGEFTTNHEKHIESADDINPAIAYTIVKDMMDDKEDEESLRVWDYLYKLCRDECTHKHIDGSTAWTYPIEDSDFKICSYCSWG